MNLQLAENSRRVSKQATAKIKPYIFIPNAHKLGIPSFIREDHFDQLHPEEYHALMKQIAPYQREVKNGSLSEDQYLAGRKAKVKARTDRKNEKSKSKAEARKTKANAKMERATHAGSGKGKAIFDQVTDTAKGIFGKSSGGGSTAPDDAKVPFYKTTTGMVVIGGVSLVVIGGIIYAMKKKK